MITVTVHAFGNRHTLSCAPDDAVCTLKARLAPVAAMAAAEMRLVAKGKTLADDDATLASVGVADGAKLMLLRSGAAPKPCRVTFRDGLRLQSYGLALKDVELARRRRSVRPQRSPRRR